MTTSANDTKLRETLVRALREVERLRAKADKLESAANEAIAIIGVGLRLPGGVRDLDELWTMLAAETDTVSVVPPSRWDADRDYDPDPDAVGKSYTREAAFLDQIDQFDPGFFNISPREAKSIDPAHRLLLETCWEALERAAIVPSTLVDSETGVFIGAGASDYQRMQTGEPDAYGLTGTQMSFAAGRVAFHLGLQGPAITVDTACSSSLVALHLACNSLRTRESSIALAAGVQVLADPQSFVLLSRTRALAPDGRCKTFSSHADGYGRGEGVVVLVLERLSDALANGREILALVRGSAVNHDGTSSGITAPNGTSQRKVLRAALADAKLEPGDVGFVECHGTGTKLGDPIEVQALAAVYAAKRTRDNPLLLGAIKTNIGHLEAASGLAGVAKILAALRHDALPATIHSAPRNPFIEWDQLAVDVVDTLRPWPRGDGQVRRAGISGFGLSGTNAHLILEDAPVPASTSAPAVEQPRVPAVLSLSGRNAAALEQQAARLRARLDDRDAPPLAEVALALLTTRAQLEHRAAVLAEDLDGARAGLDAIARGSQTPTAWSGQAKPSPKLALLFTGQGSQRAGMGKALYDAFPGFAAAFDDICASFDGLLAGSLRERMFAAPASNLAAELDRTEWTQPALFALEVALFRLYATWGIKPQLLLGHSIGELAAAHVAGVFSLADACRLVAARARAMQALDARGAMVSIQAGEDEVAACLREHVGVDIAGLNGPMSTVISGDEAAVAAVAAQFEARGRKTKQLVVSHAFHSHHMDAMLDAFRAVAQTVEYHEPKIPVISNVTGDVARAGELGSADYWVRHVRGAVRFLDGVRTLERQGARVLLELGPHGVLSAMAMACLSDAGQAAVGVVAALRRDTGEAQEAVLSLAKLHGHGVAVDWRALYGEPSRRIALPTYAFQRERYWFDAPRGHAPGSVRPQAGRHALSGERVELANGVILHALDFGPGVQSYLGDHVVYKHIVVPGAFYVAYLLAIAESHWPGQAVELRNVEFIRARTFSSPTEQLPLYAELTPIAGAAGFQVIVFTRADGVRTEHALARIGPAAEDIPRESVDVSLADTNFDDFDHTLRAVNIEWGPRWWWLRAVEAQGHTVWGRLEAREGVPPDDAPMPGGLIDSSFALLVWTRDRSGDDGTPQLPFSLARLVWYGRPVVPLHARFEQLEAGADTTTGNISYWDAQGLPVGRIERFTARRAPIDRFIHAQSTRNLYYTSWTALASPTDAALGSRTFVLSRGDRLALAGAQRCADLDELATRLGSGGEPATIILEVERDDDPLDTADRTLQLLQAWLSGEPFAGTRLVVVTSEALAVEPHERVDGLMQAPIWGLVRSAQSEFAERDIVLVDIDRAPSSSAALAGALAIGEAQLAIREGVVRVPRLAPVSQHKLLELPAAEHWRLHIPTKGSIDSLALVDYPQLELPPGHLRVAPRAVGLNFRDVLGVLDMYPGDAGPLGGEGGAVVIDVAADLQDRFAPGDRVMGMLTKAFSDSTIGDGRRLMKLPSTWSFADGATVAVVYLTAYWGLFSLGRLQAGQRVLIHAAAGGVGIAAVQLAKYVGAEIYATASPSKWPLLRELGIPDSHIASSRTLEFEAKFQATSGGAGMDVVLNSLADEFLDASLRLMPRGGRFAEMGKIDLRDAAQVATDHPGVEYLAFDILTIPDDEAQRVFVELERMFADGSVTPLPFSAWDVRHAPTAFRFMAQARHVGKVVLTIPHAPAPGGTVLVTGATGGLGARLCRHLVAAHGVRHLLLLSRSGTAAPGAEALVAELREAGASVELLACDIAQREQLAAALRSIDVAHPLTAVFHTAGVVDDGVLSSLDRERLARVFAAKVSASLHLHELTAGADLAAFVMFSSLAGTIGSAGQASYAAANVFLDALCAHRHARGLAALSLAWGPWSEGGMAARLGEADKARMARSGFRSFGFEQGFELLDACMQRAEANLAPVALETTALADVPTLSPVLRALVRKAVRVEQADAATGSALVQRLATMREGDRVEHLVGVVRSEVATVLALAGPDAIEPETALQDYGLDSLMAVELRNRMQSITGLRLSSTLLFDYPTARALATEIVGRLLEQLPSEAVRAQPTAPVERPLAPVRDDDDDDDVVAIVGMTCRLPGGIDSPEALWAALLDGVDATAAFPADRNWPSEGLYDPDPDHPGTTYTQRGGFVDQPGMFDAAFFGISPREAEAIDPQQRLLIELSWEVLERATIDPSTLMASATGVYVGVCYHDYASLAPAARDATDGYAALGSAASTASGRISYTLGLQGPAVSLDTACSTSLVALHLAVQALRNRECDLALAGGATVFATPEPLIYFSRLKALAPDGRCKSFASDGDGAGWSEGVAMLALQRLADARAQRRPILALVRGSAVNQDGRSQGLTAPNGPAQQRVIMAALASGRLTPADVDVIEAHGTGTKLGDPIEAGAIHATYGRHHSPSSPLWLGSLKSNIGHTQAAAGVAGIIKMVLAMQHEQLPRTLHADRPSPLIEWDGSVELLQSARAWPRGTRPRRAGVSAFGISGTNAHVILEDAPAPVLERPSIESHGRLGLPIVLSARDEQALREQARRLRDVCSRDDAAHNQRVAAALLSTRSQFEKRACIVADDWPAALAEFADGHIGAGMFVGTSAAGSRRLALLFTGQGAQRPGMGLALRRTLPDFAAAFDDICARFDRELGTSLLDVIADTSGSQLDRTLFAQPALFALEVALFRQLSAWGVVPELLLGHSIGELAAAHVAGVLELDAACALVAARARLMDALRDDGSMLAVQTGEAEVLELLATRAGVDIAGVNGPRSVVVSGDAAVIDELRELFEARAIKTRQLNVSHAFHSHHMDGMLDEFVALARTLSFGPPRIPIVSNLSGRLATADELRRPEYWAEHVRRAVRFCDGVGTLEQHGVDVCLELGPHGVLSSLVTDCLSPAAQSRVVALASLRRDRDELASLRLALGSLHACGVRVEWPAVHGGPLEPMVLPSYPFVRRHYWLERKHDSGAADVAAAGLMAVEHGLLAAATTVGSEGAWLCTGALSIATTPWLAEHRVFDRAVFPGAGVCELVLAAARQAWSEAEAVVIDELVLLAPLIVDARVDVQVMLDELDDAGHRGFRVLGHVAGEGDAVVEYANGRVGPSPVTHTPAPSWPPSDATQVDIDVLYARLAELGLAYGPMFRGIRRGWRRDDEVFAELELASDDAQRFGLHPALLDAIFQVALLSADIEEFSRTRTVTLPFALAQLSLQAVGTSALRVRGRTRTGAVSFEVWDAAGNLVAAVGRLEVRAASADQLRTVARGRDMYRVEWEPLANQGQAQAVPRLIIIGVGQLADAIAQRGAATGVELVRVDAWAGVGQALGGQQPELLVRVWSDADMRDAGSRVQQGVDELRAWLGEAAIATVPLLWLTENAIAVDRSDAIGGLSSAPLWGLGRAAISEAGERTLRLLDVDAAPEPSLLAAILSADGTEFATRDGRLHAPRLQPLASSAAPEFELDTGTVLITGATGTLGAHVARHLVTQHGVKHLLLTSRRGPSSASTLARELVELGAEQVELVACDVADRDALAALLATIPSQQPLRAVYHVAGVLDDAVVANISPAQLQRVLAPKLAGAWHLHELTAALPLEQFVMFSSAAGVLGNAGQGSYAAANTFLDALAAHRRARGLPALSIAWGPWSGGGMAAELDDSNRARLRRSGVRALAADRALARLDEALHSDEATVVVIDFDTRALQQMHELATLPPMLRRLAARGVRRAKPAAEQHERSWVERLTAASASEREQLVAAMVGAEIAAVLQAAEPPGADQILQDLGFDSLMAVELRNRLQTATGLRLPSTLMFEHPTPRELVARLLDELAITSPASTDTPAQPLASTASTILMIRSKRESSGESGDWHNAVTKLIADPHVGVADALGVFAALAKLRALQGVLTEVPAARPVPLSRRRDHELVVFCHPTYAPPATAFQYLQLAESMQARASVWSSSLLGYGVATQLPGSWQLQVEHQHAALMACAQGRPVVLLAHSAGGLFSYYHAALLESLGTPARAVVMLDTFHNEDLPGESLLRSFIHHTTEHLVNTGSDRADHELFYEFSAFVNVQQQLDAIWSVEPPRITTPTLYVQCPYVSEDVPGRTHPELWHSRIADLTIIATELNHFEVITQTDHTAKLIFDWLDGRGLAPRP